MVEGSFRFDPIEGDIFMVKQILWLASTSLMLSHCAGEPEKAEVNSPIEEKKVAKSPLDDPHCFKWPLSQKPPVYLKESNVVITKITKSCVTSDGDFGFQEDSSWLAMGFPCTAPSGKVEWQGYHYRPKMISFIVTTSCPMKPKSIEEVKTLVTKEIGFLPSNQLLAYHPFSLQYWELIDYAEADTGFTIEMRNGSTIDKAWKDFQKQVPIRLKLYGRENSWIGGASLYQLDVELLSTGRDRFVLHVVDTHALKEQDIKEARNKCDLLKPPRKCQNVFSF